MPPTPSPTYERLRDTIGRRMRMSHIDQPLMLMELLGRRSPAPTQDVTRRILVGGWWARFTFNGITRYSNGANSLIGGDELSNSERDQLLQLCRHRKPISGSIKDRVHRCARGRCECCGAHEHQRALEVDPIVPGNHGGTGDLSDLQASASAAMPANRPAS